MFVENILLQISFYAKLKLMWEYLARNLWADVNILVLLVVIKDYEIAFDAV